MTKKKKVKRKKLWGNKWLEVIEHDGWFTAAHNTHGDGVSVLGVDFDEGKFLIRVEHNPAHDPGFIKTALTGSIEGGLTALQTAVKELKEESGYVAEENRFRYLDWVYPSKFSDYKLHLFAVDLSGLKQGRIDGDGTRGEAGAYVEWHELESALQIRDPSVAAIIARLAGEKVLSDE